MKKLFFSFPPFFLLSTSFPESLNVICRKKRRGRKARVKREVLKKGQKLQKEVERIKRNGKGNKLWQEFRLKNWFLNKLILSICLLTIQGKTSIRFLSVVGGNNEHENQEWPIFDRDPEKEKYLGLNFETAQQTFIPGDTFVETPFLVPKKEKYMEKKYETAAVKISGLLLKVSFLLSAGAQNSFLFLFLEGRKLRFWGEGEIEGRRRRRKDCADRSNIDVHRDDLMQVSEKTVKERVIHEIDLLYSTWRDSKWILFYFTKKKFKMFLGYIAWNLASRSAKSGWSAWKKERMDWASVRTLFNLDQSMLDPNGERASIFYRRQRYFFGEKNRCVSVWADGTSSYVCRNRVTCDILYLSSN